MSTDLGFGPNGFDAAGYDQAGYGPGGYGAAGAGAAGFAQNRTLTDREFGWLCQFLFERTGIELKPGKEPMVMGRLERRLRHHGLRTYGQYLQLLATGDAAETQMAVDLLTTNETYFFREPQHFEFLAGVLEEQGSRPEVFRVWSAASSSGEEAYTTAIVLASGLPSDRAWEVFGSDISQRMVETASQALYPVEASERIPRPLLRQYCLRGRDDYEGMFTFTPAIRSRVTFRQANLLALPYDLGVFNVIFLRNVMIYFGTDTKQRVVDRLTTMLRPGGYLIVSHAETLSGIQHGLQMVRPSIYRYGASDG